jgi:hypothetical protein
MLADVTDPPGGKVNAAVVAECDLLRVEDRLFSGRGMSKELKRCGADEGVGGAISLAMLKGAIPFGIAPFNCQEWPWPVTCSRLSLAPWPAPCAPSVFSYSPHFLFLEQTVIWARRSG